MQQAPTRATPGWLAWHEVRKRLAPEPKNVVD